jgi:hypothetical protein
MPRWLNHTCARKRVNTRLLRNGLQGTLGLHSARRAAARADAAPDFALGAVAISEGGEFQTPLSPIPRDGSGDIDNRVTRTPPHCY